MTTSRRTKTTTTRRRSAKAPQVQATKPEKACSDAHADSKPPQSRSVTQHRRRQASISAILDSLFGDLAQQEPHLWDQRTYLLLVGMIYERLAVGESDLETSDLVALAKILAECRRADTSAVKQEKKEDADQTSVSKEKTLPGHFGGLVEDIYGAGFYPPDEPPHDDAEDSLPTSKCHNNDTSSVQGAVKRKERADKPNSVPRTRGGDHFSRPTVARRLVHPTRSLAPITGTGGGPPHSCLLGLAGGGVCPATTVTGRAVRSYRTISPLPARTSPDVGGVFSVALSLGSRRVGVTNHRALSSSDFPPVRMRMGYKTQ